VYAWGEASIRLGSALEMLQVIKSKWLKKSITPPGLPQPSSCLGGDEGETCGPWPRALYFYSGGWGEVICRPHQL
jgi:hypothetical protein